MNKTLKIISLTALSMLALANTSEAAPIRTRPVVNNGHNRGGYGNFNGYRVRSFAGDYGFAGYGYSAGYGYAPPVAATLYVEPTPVVTAPPTFAPVAAAPIVAAPTFAPQLAPQVVYAQPAYYSVPVYSTYYATPLFGEYGYGGYRGFSYGGHYGGRRR